VARVLLLVPTATYRATDFLAAATRLDAEVVIASNREQAMAASMGDRALVVDLDDPPAAARQIVELAGRSSLDAIVAVDDQGVVAAALAAAELGLVHNRPEAVQATRDKLVMRRALDAAGVDQPRFHALEVDDDPAEIVTAVGLPCVIKPTPLSASRGVIRVDDAASATAVAGRIRSIVADAGFDPGLPLVVEEFVAGPEVAIEGLLRGGDLEVLALFDKPDPLEGPYFEETIYVTPSRLPAPVQGTVAEVVAAACRGLGLREGPIHAEVRVADGGAKVIEVAGRSIGGLCSRTLTFGAGISLEEVILRHALDLPLGDAIEREQTASGVMMLPIPRAGRLQAVVGVDEARAVTGIEGLEITIPFGRPVAPLPDGDRYLGFLFAKASTPQEVEAILRTAHSKLVVEIS
jgi:biotin carboxylase